MKSRIIYQEWDAGEKINMQAGYAEEFIKRYQMVKITPKTLFFRQKNKLD